MLRRDTDPHQRGPRRLGKYVLIQRIAVGGMGEVFLAKMAGVEGFERQVAIKKMLPHLSRDPAFINGLVREAKLTVLLHHPNIVQVYDLAKQDDDYFIAMEYVPGITVGHLLETANRTRELVPVEVAVHITMQVLRGLEYAHDLAGADGEPMNLLHRDITPQNILVTREAWVKITDFGIAKARNEISTTSPGIIKGKLGYIAPEQLTGREADQRVDIFCAGIVLWELLVAQRLFKGNDEVDTFRLISKTAVPPLSDYRNDVPLDIEVVLHGALQRNPKQRYARADEFYDRLNMAIAPLTTDDYASAAKRYFDTHPQLFESVPSLKRNQSDIDAATIEMATLAHEQSIVEISDLMVPKKRGVGWTVALAAGAAVLLLVALGAWMVGLFEAPSPLPPPSDRPAPLTQAEVQTKVDEHRKKLLACYKSGTVYFLQLSKLLGRAVVSKAGNISNVELEPPADVRAKAPLCVEQVLRGIRVRPHPREAGFRALITLPPPRRSRPPVTSRCPRRSYPPMKPDEIQKKVGKAQVPIAVCLQDLFDVADAPDVINATIAINRFGDVTKVTFEPKVPLHEVQACLTRTISKITFRCQPAETFKFRLPLTLRKY
ncbi:MAG: serine/threonine-protein kinase [Myxococcota bacterium]